MNPKEVSKHLPLVKFEIIEDSEGRGHLVLYVAKSIEEATENKFKPKFIEHFESLEKAIQGALYIYLSGDFGISGKEKSLDCKATHQITLCEHVYGRDSGSEWADPENDIRKSGSITIDTFIGEDRRQTYTIGYAPYNPMYGISKAYITYIEMLERYLPTIEDAKNIVAFEWRDLVFNNAYVMLDQLCVAGDCINGTYKGIDSGGRVKVDYLEDYVNFHKRGEIYIVGNYGYLDGRKIFEIDDPNAIFDHNDPIIQWVKEKYPSATWLHSDNSSTNLKTNG